MIDLASDDDNTPATNAEDSNDPKTYPKTKGLHFFGQEPIILLRNGNFLLSLLQLGVLMIWMI
jgi:hypothetical protein